MILRIEYIENELEIIQDRVLALEIENKKYFYRTVFGLYSLSRGETVEEFQFYESSMKEINNPNILVINDFFNIDLDSKKISTELQKSVISEIDEKMMQELVRDYKKIYNSFNKILHTIDLPLTMLQDFNLEMFIKTLKISVKRKDELLDNLLLLIDIEKILNIHQAIFFINLKQYLSNSELVELYKYSIYSSVPIILVDSQSYGVTLEYEKKIIIDDNLDEFVL